jgi:hypothetical protein
MLRDPQTGSENGGTPVRRRSFRGVPAQVEPISAPPRPIPYWTGLSAHNEKPVRRPSVISLRSKRFFFVLTALRHPDLFHFVLSGHIPGTSCRATRCWPWRARYVAASTPIRSHHARRDTMARDSGRRVISRVLASARSSGFWLLQHSGGTTVPCGRGTTVRTSDALARTAIPAAYRGRYRRTGNAPCARQRPAGSAPAWV